MKCSASYLFEIHHTKSNRNPITIKTCWMMCCQSCTRGTHGDSSANKFKHSSDVCCKLFQVFVFQNMQNIGVSLHSLRHFNQSKVPGSWYNVFTSLPCGRLNLETKHLRIALGDWRSIYFSGTFKTKSNFSRSPGPLWNSRTFQERANPGIIVNCGIKTK